MPNVPQKPFSLDDLAEPTCFPCLAYRDLPHWELLADLGPRLQLSQGHLSTVAGGTIYCYLVLDGIIEALAELRGKLVNQCAFFLRGSIFQEPNALSGLPSMVCYKASSEATVVRIERWRLKEAMIADSRVFDLVIRSITMKLNHHFELQRETYDLDVRERIYFMLLGIASTASVDEGDGWRHLELKLTQQQMSDMLGVNRVTVNTALQELYDADVVSKREGRYAVFDGRGFLTRKAADRES